MNRVEIRPLRPGRRSEFYRQYGFAELEILEGNLGDRPAPVPMFLPLQSIPSPNR